MAYTDLTTVETLAQAALGEILQDMRDLVLDESSEFYQEATRTIEVVTSDIQSYVQRPLIVERVTRRLPEHCWEVDVDPETDELEFITRPQIGPLVEWAGDTAPEGLEAEDGSLEARSVLYTDEPIERLDAYMGYRRTDQDLPALQEDLPDMMALPSALPFVVQDVATRLCLMRLQQQINGLLGIARTQRDIGGLNQQSQRFAYQQDEEMNQMRRLQAYRRLSA